MNEKILLLDHDRDILKSLEILLKHEGYLAKPVVMDILLQKVDKLLNSEENSGRQEEENENFDCR